MKEIIFVDFMYYRIVIVENTQAHVHEFSQQWQYGSASSLQI